MLRSVLAATIVAAVVGACSSTAPSPSVPASAQSTAGPVASASAAPPASLAPSGAAPASAAPVDLKGLLPSRVGAVGLTSVQFSGSQLDASGAVDDRLKGLLTTLGRNVNDLTMAVAADPTRASDLSVTALQVRDVPLDTFIASYVPLLRQNYGKDSVSHTQRAGRQVYVAQPPGGAAPEVLVPYNDVLFVVVGTDSALVDQAIGGLP